MNNQNTKPANAKSQASLTPLDVLSMLKEGNQRFLNNKTLFRDTDQVVKNTSEGQWPYAIVLSCIDFVNREAEENVALAIQRILSKSKILRELVENGEMCGMGSGKVEFYA